MVYEGTMEINWLLICVIGIIGACVYHGYRAGLVRMVVSITTFIVTIFLVRLLAPVGVEFVKNNDTIYHAIETSIEKMLDEKVDGEIKTEEVLDVYQIPDDVKENIMKAANETGISEVNLFTPQVKKITVECLTLKVIDLMVYIVLFILINIGLRVIGMVLDTFSKIPGIKGVNKLAGSLFGVIEGLAVVWIMFIVITLFSGTAWGSACFEMIGQSTVLSIIYAKNVFLVFV